MIRLRHKLLISLFRGLDQCILMAVFGVIIFYRPEVVAQGKTVSIEASFRFWDSIGVPLLIVGWISIFHYCIRYQADRFTGLRVQLKDLLKATTLSSFWLLLISAFFSIRSINNLNIVVFFVGTSVLGASSRVILYRILATARRSGYNFRYLLIVGANQRGRDMHTKVEESPELGYKLAGFVSESSEATAEWDPELPGAGPLRGGLAELRSLLESEKVDEIMVCLPVEASFSSISQIVQDARDLGIVVRIAPAIEDSAILRTMHVEQFNGECVLTLFRERLVLQLLLKRMVDVAGACLALILLSPLLILTGLVIRLTSPGPLFFVQERMGMNKRRFKMYKFRSMVLDAEQKKGALSHLNERDGPAFKIENDPRITPVGRFIRKFSIDELPQFFNVLRGEMSLVGPRPPLPEEVEAYEWLFRKRLSVKPGLTCFWQISGREDVSFERWMEMDQAYIENWSVWVDFKILAKTVPVVLLGRGAS